MSGKESVWSRVCIADVCDSIIDCVNKTAPTVDEITPFKMIRTTNIKNGWVNLGSVKYVREETFKRWTRRQIPKRGDVILTREAPLGEVGMLRSNDRVFLGQRLVSYRTNPSRLDNRFLLYAFQHSDLQAQIKALGSGATVEHMRVPDAEKLTLQLPPLPIQRRIASILSAYDDLIENNTRRIAILEEMARLIYQEWFVRFRFPGHEKVPMVDSQLGPIPEGWEVRPIKDLFAITGGGTPSKQVEEYWLEGTINWYAPTDLTRAGTVFMDRSANQITKEGLARSSARLFPPFCVMMTSRATLGVLAINTSEACTNQGFITCVPNDGFPVYFMYHWLQANMEEFIGTASGTTFKEITKGVFKLIPRLAPPMALASAYQVTVAPMMELALNLQRKNANLRAQRDLLLPKLISGEIDVSQFPLPAQESEAA